MMTIVVLECKGLTSMVVLMGQLLRIKVFILISKLWCVIMVYSLCMSPENTHKLMGVLWRF